MSKIETNVTNKTMQRKRGRPSKASQNVLHYVSLQNGKIFGLTSTMLSQFSVELKANIRKKKHLNSATPYLLKPNANVEQFYFLFMYMQLFSNNKIIAEKKTTLLTTTDPKLLLTRDELELICKFLGCSMHVYTPLLTEHLKKNLEQLRDVCDIADALGLQNIIRRVSKFIAAKIEGLICCTHYRDAIAIFAA